MRNHFTFGSLIALLVTSTASTQQIFEAERMPPTSLSDVAAITLDKSWQVLGPFPAGMRELPFGGFPASVSSSYADLFDLSDGAQRRFSAYGPTNATTKVQTFEAQVQSETPGRVKHSLTVEYPDVDWAWIRKSAGWSSLQWQMVAVTDLEIGQNNSAVAITMDKTAEFAVVPRTSFTALRSETSLRNAIEWHTGDWYSYIAAFSREDRSSSQLPISHHTIYLDQGAYKLLVRSQYEIRIFGDPRNNGGAESPKIIIGLDIAARSLSNVERQDRLEVHADAQHSNVPHIVGGWLAGWGLSFGLRNTDPEETYVAYSIEVAVQGSDTATPPFAAKLGARLRIAPGQTVMIPVQLNQSSPLSSDAPELQLTLRLLRASEATKSILSKDVRIPLIHKPAFWEPSSSDDEHNAYMYSYLADHGTVQLAAATPPKRSGRVAARKGPLPPLILTLHGAGVDIRDMFFSNSIRRQHDNWSILPMGRTPWGYDWQLASLQAADAAVAAFHKHLYGLPPTLSAEEKQAWQFDPEKLFVMGHSNGGQGAWYRLSRFPDRAIGGMVGSAYTKVSDYVSFGWKVGRHFTDPALQGVLHSGVTMFENDLYASNLAGLDLLMKYGSADANVPPWNSKDMAMIVDGWNIRSGQEGRVNVAEVPGRPHWWDTFFSEDDVQDAIEAACSSSRNPGYKMPDLPHNFTLTIFNPAEAGSKGFWRITEVETPGRLARIEVVYTYNAASSEEGFKVSTRNVRRLELDMTRLRHSGLASSSLLNASVLLFSLNGQVKQVDIRNADVVRFVRVDDGRWKIREDNAASSVASSPRPIGPVLRIVTSKGPMVLIVPSSGPQAEVAAWTRVARRFAADLLLYGAGNSQIFTDVEFNSVAQEGHLKHSNIVTLGGSTVNSFTRSTFAAWPVRSPIHFPSPETSAQFQIQDGSFYENGTALLTLAPHPSYGQGMTLVVHGIGLEGVSRAARLLPTRTGTMIPEWVVVDSTAEWMGEGGVQAAGWYDKDWGWSDSMSYVQ